MPRRGWPSACAGSRVHPGSLSTEAAGAAYEGGPATPHVVSTPFRDVRWVAIDQHKISLVAAMLPASGGTFEVTRLENIERGIRRFVEKVGGPDGLAIAHTRQGRGANEVHRLLSMTGVAREAIGPVFDPDSRGWGRPATSTDQWLDRAEARVHPESLAGVLACYASLAPCRRS